MNRYLVITKYGRDSEEISVARFFFQNLTYHVISDDPYTVIFTTDSLEQLAERLWESGIECTVTQIGRTLHIPGIDSCVVSAAKIPVRKQSGSESKIKKEAMPQSSRNRLR